MMRRACDGAIIIRTQVVRFRCELGALRLQRIEDGAERNRLLLGVLLGAVGTSAIVHSMDVPTALVTNLDGPVGQIGNHLPRPAAGIGAIEAAQVEDRRHVLVWCRAGPKGRNPEIREGPSNT